jgi:hypothetical protein
MGFGIGIGPRIFRVRVSTRGVGLSSGVGPLSVWTSTSGGRRRSRSSARYGSTAPARSSYDPAQDIPMSDMTGADAGQLVASNSSEFIQELDQLVRPALWPWTLVITLVVAICILGAKGVALFVLIIGLAATAMLFLVRTRHQVAVAYEVEGAVADWHDSVRSRWPEVARLGGIWRIEQRGATQTPHHQKINAGAGHLVKRNRVTAMATPHRRVKSNIELPTFVCGKHSLAFLPDHILVRSGRKWSELDYGELHVAYQQQRFIEDGGVPRDSQQVGTTWQYVNKKGGPDRRFKNNRQLPIMLYGEVELTTPYRLWMVSRLITKMAIHKMAST